MTFPVNNTNNITIATVLDYTIDTSTSLNLIGDSVINYGEPIAENFIRLLENFASPGNTHPTKEWIPTNPLLANPQIGQIWFHTYIPGPPAVTVNRMRYWSGTRWETFTYSVNTVTEPTNPQVGDLWFDQSCAQLVYWGPIDGVKENPSSIPTWVNLNSALKRNDPPIHPAHGCLWWMLPEAQLWMYDSDNTGSCRPVGYQRRDNSIVPGGWTLIGPMSSINAFTYIQNTLINGHNAIEYWLDGHIPAIWSDRDQTINPALNDGYDDFLTYSTDGNGNVTLVSALKKGLNLNLNTCNILNGVAINAVNFDNWSLKHFYRTHLDLLPTLIDGTTLSDDTRKIGQDGTRFAEIHAASFYGGDSTTTTAETNLDFPPAPYTNTLINNSLPVQFHGRADRALYSDGCRLSLLTVKWETPRFTSVNGHVEGVCDATNSSVDGTQPWTYTVSFSATGDSYMDNRSSIVFNRLITPYNTRITSLENRMTSAENKLKSDDQTLANHLSRITSLETSVKADESTLNDCVKRLNNDDTSINTINNDINNIENVLTNQQTELDSHQQRLDSLSSGGSGGSGSTTASYPVEVYQNVKIINNNAGKLNFTSGINATDDTAYSTDGYVNISVPTPAITIHSSGLDISNNASTLDFTGDAFTVSAGSDTSYVSINCNFPIQIISNQRVAQTAQYTVMNSDKGKTIALGGNSSFSVNFSSASNYDPDFLVIILNEDTANGKFISLGTNDPFILWPLQSLIIFNQNNVWQINPELQRWKWSASTTFYVNPVTGSDSNDGLSLGGNEFATINNALSVLYKLIDCNGWAPVISIADGAYTEQLHLNGNLVGANQATIIGNVSNPSNVNWYIQDNQVCITATNGANIVIKGISFSSSGLGSIGLQAETAGIIAFGFCQFGAFDNGYQMAIHHAGCMLSTDTYMISGSAAAHIIIESLGVFTSTAQNITINENISFSEAFLINISGYFEIENTINFNGTGSVAGQIYDCRLNSVSIFNGTTLPGNTVGAYDTGAQILA